jgi:hypothetical protein
MVFVFESSLLRARMLLGREQLLLQGIHVADDVFEQFTDAQLRDLAGNAFSATAFTSIFLAALMTLAVLCNGTDPSSSTSSDFSHMENINEPMDDDMSVIYCDSCDMLDIHMKDDGMDEFDSQETPECKRSRARSPEHSIWNEN